MNKRYSGLCIGGPRDGKRVDSDMEFMRVHVLPKGEITYCGEPIDRSPVGKVFVYQHIRGIERFHGANPVLVQNFWVPQGEDLTYVFRALIGSYERNTNVV